MIKLNKTTNDAAKDLKQSYENFINSTGWSTVQYLIRVILFLLVMICFGLPARILMEVTRLASKLTGFEWNWGR